MHTAAVGVFNGTLTGTEEVPSEAVGSCTAIQYVPPLVLVSGDSNLK